MANEINRQILRETNHVSAWKQVADSRQAAQYENPTPHTRSVSYTEEDIAEIFKQLGIPFP